MSFALGFLVGGIVGALAGVASAYVFGVTRLYMPPRDSQKTLPGVSIDLLNQCKRKS